LRKCRETHARELHDQRVDLVGALVHQHVTGARVFDQTRPGDQVGDPLRVARRRQRVPRPDEHQRGHPDRWQPGGEVEAEERGAGIADRLAAARAEHLPRGLHVARVRVVAEPDAGEEEAQVPLTHQGSEIGTHTREPLERVPHPPRVTHQVVRRRRLQHQALHPRPHDVGMTDDERLHGHPAHRMADQYHVVEVERLEHHLQVVGQVVDRVPGLADRRFPVAARIERHRAEAGCRERLELLRRG